MLKIPFSNAPDFSLPSRGGLFRLSDLESRHRVALLFPPDAVQALAAIKQLENNFAQWLDRDLKLVLIVSENAFSKSETDSESVVIARDEPGEVARLFGISSGETAFFLLGKSHFPVALAVDYFPDDAQIFALIDVMPMRKSEMRQREKSR